MISLEYAPLIVTSTAQGYSTGIPDDQNTMTQISH
jgi:hypothetical protein